jgi:hypothetical protein
MAVAIEVDGVLYPTKYAIHRFWCEYRDKKVSFYDFWKAGGVFENLPAAEVEYLLSSPVWRNSTIPPKNLVDAVNALGEVYYITRTKYEWLTERYLRKNGFPFPGNLISTDDIPSLCITDFISGDGKFDEEVTGLVEIYKAKYPTLEAKNEL